MRLANNALHPRSRAGRTARSIAALALPVAMLAAGAVIGAAPAGAIFGWEPLGVTGPWPSNTQSPVDMSGTAVSCGTLGDCVSVGWYYDASGYLQPTTDQAVNGTEEQPQEVVVPSNAATNPNAMLTGVSCPQPSECTAVGYYTANDATQHAMVVTDVAGSWGQASELPDPSDAHAGNASVHAAAVSCWSVGNCVAVGNYVAVGGHNVPLIETDTNGVWTASSSVSVPAGTLDSAVLNGVSCPGAGSCLAVGNYNDPSDHEYGFQTQLSAGTWSPSSTLVPPSDAVAGNPSEYANAVSCWAVANCMIVGTYATGPSGYQGFGQQMNNGVLGLASATQAASNEYPTRYDDARSVSCPVAQVCVAVGSYWDDNVSASVQHGIVQVYQYGQWTSQTIQDPSYFVGYGVLNAVSCAASGSCFSSGAYSDTSGGTPYLEMHAKLYTFMGEVTNPTIVQTGASTGTYSWGMPNVVGPGVKSFVPEMSANGGHSWIELPFPFVGPPELSTKVTGLLAHHTYEFEVAEVSTTEGLIFSTPTLFTTAGPPSAPRSVHAAAGHLSATVSWSAPASNGGAPVGSYTVTLAWAGGSRTLKVAGSTTHVVVAGLLHAKTYSVSVRAANVAGSSPASAAAHVTPLS